MSDPLTLEAIAQRAVEGESDALDALVRALQNDIYSLAIRMLWNREDAEDATQEILVRVITRLSQFDGRSQLKTWVYRVAVNYLLDVKKSAVERMHLRFAAFADDLADGLSTEGPADGERSVLTEEVRIGCTLAMLQCLDRPHRLAYTLGEIFECSAPEAAQIMDVTPVVFRKRLQRARQAIARFTRAYCGLVTDAAACQCNRRVPVAMKHGRARAEALDFAVHATSFVEARAFVRRVDEARRAFEVHRDAHLRSPSVEFVERLSAIVHAIEPTRS